MKKILIFLVVLLLHTVTVWTHPFELVIRYWQNGHQAYPSGYKVWIKSVGDSYVYDENFDPIINRNSPAYQEIERSYVVNFQACYTCSNDTTSGDGLAYYGKYQIRFKNNYDQVIATAYIDFRDDEYGYPCGTTDGYSDQDFYVEYDLDSNKVKFRHASVRVCRTNNSATIWNLEEKNRDISLFKNFYLDVSGLPTGVSTNIQVGASNYSLSNGQSISLAKGSQSITLSVQHRKASNNYFSSWGNGTIIDTTMNVTTSDDLTKLSLVYKTTNQTQYITGPTEFQGKVPLKYVSHHNVAQGTVYHYNWVEKFESGGWQDLYGDDDTVTVSGVPGYPFYIKCFLRDQGEQVGVWSDALYVTDDINQRAMGLEKLNLSETAQSSMINSSENDNAALSALQQRLDFLLPLEDHLKLLAHKFRWTDDDPYIWGPDTTSIKELQAAIAEMSLGTSAVTCTKNTHASESGTLNKEILSAQNAADDFIPQQFALHANYPNPFNPSTTIAFDIAEPVFVKLTIYNTLGQQVRNLYNDTKSAGRHHIVWDGKNNYGVQVPSGVYLYQIRAGSYNQSRKMLLVK